jgi:hypothetical protein
MVFSPFVIDALRVPSETKKGRPVKMTNRPMVKVYGSNKIPPACCLYLMNLTSFLFLAFGSKDLEQLTERCFQIGYGHLV